MTRWVVFFFVVLKLIFVQSRECSTAYIASVFKQTLRSHRRFYGVAIFSQAFNGNGNKNRLSRKYVFTRSFVLLYNSRFHQLTLYNGWTYFQSHLQRFQRHKFSHHLVNVFNDGVKLFPCSCLYDTSRS